MQWPSFRPTGVLHRRHGHGGKGLFTVVVGLLTACGVAGVSGPVALASSSPGPTWTLQHPATSPPARFWTSTAYDAATGTVVLFGGRAASPALGDTWVWDGS